MWRHSTHTLQIGENREKLAQLNSREMEVIKTKETPFPKLKPHSNEEHGENRDLLQVKCRNTV